MEAEQYPTASMTKQMTIKILQGFYTLLNKTLEYKEEMDPDYERSGVTRRRMLAAASHCEQMLYEKRRKTMQSTLDRFFKKKSSLRETSASNEPHPGTSTGSYTHPHVTPLLPSSSDVDDLASCNSLPPPPTPSLSLSK